MPPDALLSEDRGARGSQLDKQRDPENNGRCKDQTAYRRNQVEPSLSEVIAHHPPSAHSNNGDVAEAVYATGLKQRLKGSWDYIDAYKRFFACQFFSQLILPGG